MPKCQTYVVPVLRYDFSTLKDFPRSQEVAYTVKNGNVSETVQDRDVVTTGH